MDTFLLFSYGSLQKLLETADLEPLYRGKKVHETHLKSLWVRTDGFLYLLSIFVEDKRRHLRHKPVSDQFRRVEK